MKGSILFVDDNHELFPIKKLTLEEEGYFIIPYKDGENAIYDIYHELKYDLAIIDLSLPNIDGNEIIGASKHVNPQVPVISLSGYAFKPPASNRHVQKATISPDRFLEIIDSFFQNKS